MYFKWVQDICKFDESFIKGYKVTKGYFLEGDFQYPEKLHELRNDLPFSPERMNIEKVEKPVGNFMMKLNRLLAIEMKKN